MVTKTSKSGSGQVVGVTGLSIWGGVLGEEYLTALKGTRKAKVFKEMQDDAVVATLLDAMAMPLMAAEFETIPAGDTPRDKENADFLWECMNDMTRYTWRQHVMDMMTVLVWGWSASEVVFKKRMGPEGQRPSQYNDGKIGFHILDPRGQDTLYQWKMDEEFNVESMVQQDPNSSKLIDIPSWKLLHATFRSRKRSPEGSSPLRSLYRAWYTRKNLEIIEAIGAERDLCGLPVIHLPFGATDTDKSVAETLIRNVRQDHEAGLIIPAPLSLEGGENANWKFELISSPGSKQFNVRQIIQDLNKIILMRFFAQFLMLGMEQVGTQALVEGSQDFFSLCLKSIQQEFLEMWNQQMVPLLFSMNPQLMSAATGYPTLDWMDPGSKDIQKVVNMAIALINSQVLTPEAELEDFFRAMMGLPDRPEGLGEGPRQPKFPGGPLSGIMAYDWAEQTDGSWIVKPKSQPKTYAQAGHKASCMVAIPVEANDSLVIEGGTPPEELHVTLTFHGDDMTQGQVDNLVKFTKVICEDTAPFKMSITDADVFPPNDEGKTPYIAFVESEELMQFRERLAKVFDLANVQYSKKYEYNPHITLKYLKAGESQPDADPEGEFTVDRVMVKWGDDRTEFRLGGSYAQPDPGDVHIPTAGKKKRRDQCMRCWDKPTVDVLWGSVTQPFHAWFCDDHFLEWNRESMTHTIVDMQPYGQQFISEAKEYEEVDTYAEVSGIRGRRGGSKIGNATNEYQGLLTRIYDLWSAKAQRAIVGASEHGRRQALKEIDRQLLALSKELKQAGSKHIDEAVRLGFQGTLDTEAQRLVKSKVRENDKYIDTSLIPRVREKIVSHLDDVEEKQYAFDATAFLGLLQSMRGEPAAYAGAFWSAIFLGVGLTMAREDRERQDAGQKPRRVRWVLDPSAQHCKNSAHGYGCPDLAGIYDSWDDLPTVPAGQVTCLGNCRCHIEVETSGGWDRVA